MYTPPNMEADKGPLKTTALQKAKLGFRVRWGRAAIGVSLNPQSLTQWLKILLREPLNPKTLIFSYRKETRDPQLQTCLSQVQNAFFVNYDYHRPEALKQP